MHVPPRLNAHFKAPSWIWLAPMALLVSLSAQAGDEFEQLRINQFQVIGTHNSYHVRPASLAASVRANRSAQEWDYTHAPLDEQLTRGVRSFELDLHDTDDGLEVFHVPVLDQGSTCRDFKECLATIRKWSEENPRHFPISVLIEVKDDVPRLAKRVREFGGDALERLDQAIRNAFESEQLITPDDVRGEHESLRAAVLTGAWPRLEDARGRVFFVLHESGTLRDLYVGQRDSLQGRAMFVRAQETRPDAAVLVLDNPHDSNIARLVDLGYLVRTRADSGLRQGRTGDTRSREAALASGAQIISTDFPPGEAHPETGYSVEFPPGSEARVNPVNGPEQHRRALLPFEPARAN